MKTLCQLTCLLVLFAAQSAKAVTVEYNLAALGGNSFQYEYTVTNDGSLGAGVAIEWFAVLFDPALYDETSLTIVTPEPLNTDWDQIILSSGLLIPAAYDAFALTSSIAEGESVTGFSVIFDWLGAGLPGSQAFEIYDATTNDLIYEGMTVVPLPGAFILLLTSLFSMGALNVKRRLIG